ncbi:FAD-dependent monooxygenase [Bartonella sp. DGB1]|uniref:FAD-dependent monooxygenase n=1 Tax=Bartonella sp. DGB1 TaxID=3239807 RepID=UPI0035254353
MNNQHKITQQNYTIAIIGGGLTGKLAVLYLAYSGYQVIHIATDLAITDERTTAIMMPGINLLRELNIMQYLQPFAEPLKAITLIDESHKIFSNASVTFTANEINEEAFGYNIPNKNLNDILKQEISKKTNVTAINDKVINIEVTADSNIIYLEKNNKLNVDIIIAADGANSISRNYANIEIDKTQLLQTAAILSFSHEFPHKGMSIEFQTPQGPFTQVPLQGNNSSLVWVMSNDIVEKYKDLGKKQLNKIINNKLSSYLGDIKITSDIQFWELKLQLAKKIANNNIILIGESAHIFPPLGAQGLNLTIRDILSLPEALNKSSKQEIMTFYNNNRLFDIKSRSLLIKNLNHSLITSILPIKFLRMISFNLLKHSSFLRKFISYELLTPKAGLNYLKSFFKNN